MVDSTQGYESTVEAAGAALARGDAASIEQAESLYRDALTSGERALGPYDVSLVPALTGLGATLILRDRIDEAEPVLTRAVGISEQQLGGDHPDFVILLNDLSRLYLKHGGYRQAEPLLQRLLELKRAKGEAHPEVATVLSSLSTVRQSLGRHDEAEQMSRRVLEIREQTLAPNHISTAAALEHLAQTCAARGKVHEALQHYQRSLGMREITLGSQHPSLRALRERIADLQLQASDDLFDAGDAPTLAPTRPRLSFIPPSVSNAPPRASAQQRQAAPRPIRDVELLEREPAALQKAGLAVPSALTLADAPQMPAPATVPYLDVLMDIKDEFEDPEDPSARPQPQGRFAAALASLGTAFRERRVVAVGAVSVIAVPLIALGVAGAMRSNRSLSFVTQTSVAASLPAADTVAPAAAIPGDPLRAPIANGDVHRDSSGAIRIGASAASQRSRTPENGASRRDQVDAPIYLADVPRASVGRLDSVVRSINVPSQNIGESFQVQLQSSLAAAQRSAITDLQPNVPARQARLIGEAPVPTYPYELARSRIGGEVRVRFEVDTLGRPVISSFTVVKSPHARFSESVKRVVPAMRFDPARGPGPTGRTVSETVEMTFHFTPLGND